MQIDIIINLWANCSSGFMVILFAWSHKIWNVIKPGAWVARPPTGTQQSQSPPILSKFSRSVLSHSLWPYRLQQGRLPCQSPTPGVCSNSCSLSQWCHPTISSSVISFSSSLQHCPASGSFCNESVLCLRWMKYWSFNFSIRSSNEYSGLISFRIDWLDLLLVQWTLRSLLQHHSSKASVLWRSTFFMVQLPHPYVTTGKTIALTTWTFVSKVMSLLFNNSILKVYVVACARISVLFKAR